MAACGRAAADFKGYQLVGVNFLMLLARAGVGGAILADEMARGPPRACCCPLDERRPRVRLASLHDRRSVGAAPNVCTVVLAVDSAQRGALMMPLLANLYRLIHGVSSLRRAWARPRRRLHSWVRTFDLDCAAELMSPAVLCASAPSEHSEAVSFAWRHRMLLCKTPQLVLTRLRRALRGFTSALL